MEHKQTVSGFVSKVIQAGAATRVLLGFEPSSDSNHSWLFDFARENVRTTVRGSLPVRKSLGWLRVPIATYMYIQGGGMYVITPAGPPLHHKVRNRCAALVNYIESRRRFSYTPLGLMLGSTYLFPVDEGKVCRWIDLTIALV